MDRACLWSWDVIFFSSHISGGAQEGSGRKLGRYRGEGVSGDCDINFRSFGTCDYNEIRLSSLGPALSGGPGSTLFVLPYALRDLGWNGDNLLSPGNPVPQRKLLQRWLEEFMPFERCEMYVLLSLPDLNLVQLRAPSGLPLGDVGGPLPTLKRTCSPIIIVPGD